MCVYGTNLLAEILLFFLFFRKMCRFGTKRQQTVPTKIPNDVIERAINEVYEGAKIQPTARKYDIPRSSLQRYLKSEEPLKNSTTKYITRKIFTDDEESALIEYLVRCSQLHDGLKKLNCRKFAYEYAVANGKDVPENWKQHKYASKDWIRGFMSETKIWLCALLRRLVYHSIEKTSLNFITITKAFSIVISLDQKQSTP